MSLVHVADLSIKTRHRTLVEGVSFDIAPGERVGLIGESGSGKSLTAMTLMGLLPENLTATGTAKFDGMDILAMNERQMAGLRGKRISVVFQEPLTALNPLQTIGEQVREVMTIHETASKPEAERRMLDLLADVQLPDPKDIAKAYPHQLSGGQRQRVLIAIALANSPDVLICDEPTTALDVTVQRQIVDLIVNLTEKYNTALLFITHDLGLVSLVCDRVMVMREGKLVDSGTIAEVLTNPRHEYTRGLLAASDLDARDKNGRLYTVETAQDGSYQPGHAHAHRKIAPVGEELVSASHLTRIFGGGGVFRKKRMVLALDDVSISLRSGQRLGIVGGSGSGKTTLMRIIGGLDQPTTGHAVVCGAELGSAEHPLSRSQRAKADRIIDENVQIVFQDPMSSLDPRMTVGRSVEEPLLRTVKSASDRKRRVREVLDEVGIPESAVERYPHEFSGGQRQRISIARALSVKPKILLADEPVSALDVSVRAQVLNLLGDLVDDYGLTLVFVSHDLAVVRQLCTDVIVMKDGQVLERGTVQDVYESPDHPYTQSLLAAVPKIPVVD